MSHGHRTLREAIAAAMDATQAANRTATEPSGWDAAVGAWDAVAARLPGGIEAGAQALALDGAARTRLGRFWAGGPETDIDVAVDLWRRATRVMPPDLEVGAVLWNNLVVALRDLFDRDGAAGLLDEAVAAGEAAVGASDRKSPVGVGARLQLGRSLRLRFKEKHCPDDLDAAIAVLTDATGAAEVSGDAVHAECHEVLGNLFSDRYQLTSDSADQEAACTHLRSAVESLPADDVDLSTYSNNLASALLDRFERTRERADLDEAIERLDAAVTASGGETGASSDLLTNIGNALRLRAVAHGTIPDIERSVDLSARAVEVEAHGVRRAAMLSNLASGLLDRYDLTGRIADVEEAFAILVEAVEATPADDPDRSARLNNFGIALRTRQLRRREGREVLDRAVAAFEEAIAARPERAPEAAAFHANLGNVLHQRYDVAGDRGDLDRAVREFETALARTPEASADRASSLNNLAATLSARAAQPGGTIDDLERAAQCAQEAVRLCAPGSAQCATFLVNLGNVLSERYARSKEPHDLVAGREAFRSAAGAGLTASPAEALAAAHNWSEWARDRREWGEVAEAYGYGEQAMSALIRTQLLRADKESWLRDAQGLVADGAYAFVACSELRDATIALERGRALLLSEALERGQADLTRLESDHASLVARYRTRAARVGRLELSSS